MSYISKEQQPQFQLAVPEIENDPDYVYLRNMLWLGKMTAVQGQYKEGYPTQHEVIKRVESCADRRRGYEIKVGFLLKPRTLCLNNFDYPMITLDKRGNDPDPSQYITYRPERTIGIVLKSDGLVGLTVMNSVESRREYEEALQYEDPPEITDRIYGITRRVQLKSSRNPYYVYYSGYPQAVCSKAKELLNSVTTQAVEEFTKIGFILPLNTRTFPRP